MCASVSGAPGRPEGGTSGVAGSDQGEWTAGRERFGTGECSGVAWRLSGRDWRLLSEVAELDIRRES